MSLPVSDYRNHNRVMPKVPGIHGNALVPSIGCDSNRVSKNQRHPSFRKSSNRCNPARPISGSGRKEKMNATKSEKAKMPPRNSGKSVIGKKSVIIRKK